MLVPQVFDSDAVFSVLVRHGKLDHIAPVGKRFRSAGSLGLRHK